MDRLDAGSGTSMENGRHQQMDEQLKKNEQVQEAITVNDKAAARENIDHADVPKWQA